MARLQILELPMVHNGDQTETPFILVIDDWTVDTLEENAAISAYWDDFAQKIGARGVLCSDRTIDIPANDTSAYTLAAADAHLAVDGGEVRDLIAGDAGESPKQAETAPIKSGDNWCCSLAFQTLGRQHVDDCGNA
jgi:hypothetical protein